MKSLPFWKVCDVDKNGREIEDNITVMMSAELYDLKLQVGDRKSWKKLHMWLLSVDTDLRLHIYHETLSLNLLIMFR